MKRNTKKYSASSTPFFFNRCIYQQHSMTDFSFVVKELILLTYETTEVESVC